jgi:TPR repeat protein
MDSREFDLLRNKAALGDIEAQLNLASIYSDGLESVGVKPNAGLAVKWYGIAAEQGSGEAQHALSYYQSRGLGGLERNQEIANQLLEKAAHNGHPQALHWLGKQHENKTNGFVRDYEKAFACYEASANQGYALAQFEVGRLYQEGKGIEWCAKTAEKWYMKSAEQGEPLAMYQLGVIHECGDRYAGIPVNMEKAAQFYKASAERCHDRAHLKMADFYLHGVGVEQNYAESFKHYEAATISSEPFVFAEAKLGMGIHYQAGVAVPVNHAEAAQCFKESAEAGSREAHYQLGVLYSLRPELEGGGIERSIQYLQAASENAHGKASMWLGDMYVNGWGVLEKDIDKAVEYYAKASASYNDRDCRSDGSYKQASVMRDELLDKGQCSEEDIFKLLKQSAELGHQQAALYVGFHYLKGQGVEANPKEAAHWFKQAADNGFDSAKYQLAEMYLDGTGVEQNHNKAFTLLSKLLITATL